MSKADEKFAKETLALMERCGIEHSSGRKKDGRFSATFSIKGTGVKYSVVATSSKTDRVYVLDDPRHYSGPGTSRAAIEEYDRSEKVQRWEEKEKMVTIKATGLPEIGAYQARFTYDPEGYIDDHVRTVERILSFLTDRISQEKEDKKNAVEQADVEKIGRVFARI